MDCLFPAGKYLEPEEGYPNGRAVAGPFCWIEYASGSPAYEAVLHAHGKYLISQDAEVELDRTELDGTAPHC